MEAGAAGAAPAAARKAPEQVVVHPLVLLSVVDQYNRVAKDTKKRVVGVLLGESYKGRIDATNSFAGAGASGGEQRRCILCVLWAWLHARGAGRRQQQGCRKPGLPGCSGCRS